MAQIITHGVVRVTGDNATIDGQAVDCAYVMPPRAIDIEGAASVHSRDPIEDCTIAELKTIARWLGVSTSARTTKGLIKAIQKQVVEAATVTS